MNPSQILTMMLIEKGDPPCVRVELLCSVCGQRQWLELPLKDASDLEKTEHLHFVCSRHAVPVEQAEATVTRCQVCKDILFVGPSDPLEHYSAGLGGWRGGVPIAVRRGSWRNLWRRTWYHQACCGVYIDRTDRSGRWHIFG